MKHVPVLSCVVGVHQSNLLMTAPVQTGMCVLLYIHLHPMHVGLTLGMCINTCVSVECI